MQFLASPILLVLVLKTMSFLPFDVHTRADPGIFVRGVQVDLTKKVVVF